MLSFYQVNLEKEKHYLLNFRKKIQQKKFF